MGTQKNRVEPELQIGADTLNMDVVGEKINGRLTPAQARAINEAARKELEKVRIAGHVSVEVTANGPAGVTGSFRRNIIRLIRPGGNWLHTLNHEAIHALREPSLWGTRHSLFTSDEWRALVLEARSNKAIRARVEAAYPDLDLPSQNEEMVAEMYADWAQGHSDVAPGPIRAAYEQIPSFFRAVANALHGEGFLDAANIMEDIANGTVGGRPPSGPAGPGGRGRESAREQRETGPFGPVLRGYEGDWKEAALALEEMQDGEAPGALHHPDVGARAAMPDAHVRRLMTIPGVDMVVTIAVMAAIGRIDRFASADQLSSYLGLNPTVRQPGDGAAYHGRITKRGRSDARHLLVEAA